MKTSEDKVQLDRTENSADGFEPVSADSETDKRSLDIGESEQFAPGGYYNQQGKHAPRRIDLDDELVPRRRQSPSCR